MWSWCSKRNFLNDDDDDDDDDDNDDQCYKVYKFSQKLTAEINLWWSDIPISKVLESLFTFFWLVSIRLNQLGLLDWTHVASLIRLVRLYACGKLSRGTSSLERLKSPINVTISWFF